MLNKWFGDLQTRLAAEECTVVRDFCCAASAVLKTYCDAAVRSLEGEPKILPATALLRIICEFVTTFLWCTHATTEQEFESNLGLWQRYSAWEKKRMHKELLPTVDTYTKKIFDSEMARLDKIVGKAEAPKDMPKIRKRFEVLKGVFGYDIYARSYLQFNPAVHIDYHVLTSTTKHMGNQLCFEGDWDEDIDKLKLHCLSSVYYFVRGIFGQYNWDCTEMDNVFAQIAAQPNAQSR